MFIVNQKRKGVKKEFDRFLTVLHSINEPMIAAADHPAEATQAFICTMSLPDDRIEAHIILFLKQSGLRVMYSWDEGEMNADLKMEMEEEALDFVENMGFMMDNLNLEKLSADQRKQMLAELPIYEGAAGPEPPPIQEIFPEEELEELVAMEEEEPTTNVRPKPTPPPVIEAPSAEVDSLAMLDAEFGRQDDDFGEPIDAALEKLMGVPSKPVRETPAPKPSPPPMMSAPTAKGESGTELFLRLMASF
jgi:hypothetical protein